mgnify:CR=1 FL=1
MKFWRWGKKEEEEKPRRRTKAKKKVKKKGKKKRVKITVEEYRMWRRRFKYTFLAIVAAGLLMVAAGLLFWRSVVAVNPPGAGKVVSFYVPLYMINGAGMIGGGVLGYFRREPMYGGVLTLLYAISGIVFSSGIIGVIGSILGLLSGGLMTYFGYIVRRKFPPV